MDYVPLSPFRRPISHIHLRAPEPLDMPLSGKPISKWEILRELSTAQVAFGVTERDLTVLQGLLSFFPHDALGGNAEMVIFPSNKSLCERLNGMPCSTMRRHLALLVNAGLITRRDSPNGKRYVRRHGEDRIAYGFDLVPLLRRSEEIARAADAVREAEARIRRMREIVSLMRRDLAALAEYGESTQPGHELWGSLQEAAAVTARALRRRLVLEELEEHRTRLNTLLDQAREVIDGPDTEEMITSDAKNGRHHHNSKQDSIVFEPGLEKARVAAVTPEQDPDEAVDALDEPDTRRVPNIPLHLVVVSCPSLKTFYPGQIRHWHQLYDAACHVRPAMGISASAWEEAQRSMGLEQAAIVVVAMLERFADIRSPGGYLRALTIKAEAGQFSCGPMVMALIGRKNAA